MLRRRSQQTRFLLVEREGKGREEKGGEEREGEREREGRRGKPEGGSEKLRVTEWGQML